MASSSFPAIAAVKFWVPNLGARAPVNLSTGNPDYSEYVRSGLWVQRRRLHVCDGTGITAYMPDGDRSWPDTFPVSNMKIYQTYCQMEGVTQEKVLNPLSALEILEGQVTSRWFTTSRPSKRPIQRFTYLPRDRSGKPPFWPISWGLCTRASSQL